MPYAHRFLVMALLGVLTGWACAEQAAWVSEADGRGALEWLKPGGEFRMLSAPGETAAGPPQALTEIRLEPSSEPGKFAVVANGKGVDLATVYVSKEGKWANLAMLLNLPVTDMPEFLDAPADAKLDFVGSLYEGKVDEKHAFILDLSRQGNNLDGAYAYLHIGEPIAVKGEIKPDGAFQLTEYTEDKPTGVFEGALSLDGRSLSGTWKNEGEEGALPFKAQRFAVREGEERTEKIAGVETKTTLAWPIFEAMGGVKMDALNAAVKKTVQDAYAQFRTSTETALNAVESGEEELPEMSFDMSYYMVTFHSPSMASMFYMTYEYSGGAHGMSSFTPYNARISADGSIARLALKDLFNTENYLEPLSAFVLDVLEKAEASFVVDGTVASFSAEDLASFTLSPRGATFHFDPYAVASYAEGTFDVVVPFTELKELWNPELIKALGG